MTEFFNVLAVVMVCLISAVAVGSVAFLAVAAVVVEDREGN